MSPLLPLLLAVPIAVGVACWWMWEPERPLLAKAALAREVVRQPSWWLTISLVTEGDAWFFSVPTPDWNFCAQSINLEAIKASAGTLAVSCVDLNAATVVR